MSPHYEIGRTGTTIRLEDGDQIYLDRVANFVIFLAQPANDSSTAFDFGPEKARELAGALTDYANQIEADTSNRTDS